MSEQRSLAQLWADNPFASAEELGLMQGFPPPADRIVNKSNALMTPPYNRWAYTHMRSIFPTAPIAPASEAVHLQRSINTRIGDLTIECPETGKQAGMESFLRETYTDSIVVLKGDQVIYERYFNGMTADQPHQMMSVTKSFSGLMALMAVESGHLNEDKLVTDYVPELKTGGGFDGATLGQVLDMTNAMAFSEIYDNPASDICTYGTVIGWLEPIEGRSYPSSLHDYLPTIRAHPSQQHGEIYAYQTPKTDVVNWVTNRVFGQSLQELLADNLWSKLGTDAETYVLLDNSGALVAGGGLNATPNNLARFAAMLLNNGSFRGQQVVPPTVIDKLRTGGSTEAFSKGPECHGPMANGDWSYRAQWWIRHTAGKAAFTGIGVHGQWLYIDAERDIAIIKQSSQPESVVDNMDAYVLNAFDAIIEKLAAHIK